MGCAPTDVNERKGTEMAYYLDYYIDTIPAGASATVAAAKRMIYVYSGSASIGGRTIHAPLNGETEADASAALYSDEETRITAGQHGTKLFRFDLVEDSKADKPVRGDGATSVIRMSREIWCLDIKQGSEWLFRLDYIRNPAGQTADVHTHEGPGIRALITGTFHVNQPSEEGRAAAAGDPWWETGIEAVISTPSGDEPAKFLRGMVLPRDMVDGRPSGKFLRKFPPAAPGWKVWELFVDRLVTL